MRSAGTILRVLPAFAAVCVMEQTALAQTATVFPREVVAPEPPRTEEQTGTVLAVPAPEVATASAAGPGFVLRGVEVEGSSVYDRATLQAAVADFIGRKARFSDLERVADAIEQLYRDDGYLAARALIPAQEVEGGVLRVRVVEGVIETVVLRGDLGRAEPKVRELLEPLIGVRPLRWTEAERRLLLARDLPGVSLIASLRAAGAGEGGLALIVDGSFDVWDGFAALSNYSADTVGPLVATAGAAVNSLILPGDRLQGTLLVTPQIGEQEVGLVSYEAPVLTDGFKLRGWVSATRAEPGDVLEPLDIDYAAYSARIEAEYALIRTRDRSAWVAGGLDATWQDSESGIGPGLDIDEQLRVGFLRGRFVTREWLGGLTDLEAEGRAGLSFLGASEEGDEGLSPEGSDPQFLSLQGRAEFLRPIGAFWTIDAELRGQIGSDDLPSLERFSLGNYTIGRGFDPGSVSGDSGIAASLEGARRLEIDLGTRVSETELFGFLEGGQAWTAGDDDALASVGAGARARLFDRLDVEGVVIAPLIEPEVDDGGDIRFLFRALTMF